jgi:F-type H+-transporting ATPase subunit b
MPELHLLALGDELGFVPAQEAEELEAEVEEESDPPNPVLPDVHEIVWAAVFFVALWMLMKYTLYPKVKSTMDARAAKLAADRDAADSAAAELGSVQADYDQALAAARAEAAGLVDEARGRAEDYRLSLVTAADAEIAEIKATAVADVEAARSAALESLRPDVRTLAVGAASQVLGTRLDEGSQSTVIDSYLDSVD